MGKKFRENENLALKRFCLSIIRWGTYLVLFTPLIISRRSFFPFVTPKTIYFRVLVEIIFAAYLILVIYFPRYRPKINILSISIFIFVGVLILTSFLGINFERSFWSTFERMTGLFTFFHLLVFFIILTSCFNKREDWEKILSVSILVGILLCFYVLLPGEIGVSTRGGGTIGNTSFMAAYLLFDIFFALILFLEKKTSGWRIFSGISLIIFIPVLLTSTARGAIISFFGGLALFLLGYLIFSGEKNLKKMGVFLVLFLIVLGIILAIYQPAFIKNTIEITLQEMKPRFVVWEKAWKGFLQKPIFGWGPENFNVVFTKFFNPCMFLSECGGEIWFDRAHNIVLDSLVATGVVGLLSYLLIFAVSIFGLLRVYLKEKRNIFSFLGMAVLLIVYFFQNLLVFDMISSYTVFFLSLGFVTFLITEKEDSFFQPAEESSNSPLGVLEKGFGRYLIFGVIGVLTVSLLYFGNIQPANSAVDTVHMIVSSVNLEKRLDFYKKALNTLMEKYEIREQFAQRVYEAGFDLTEDRQVLESAFLVAEEQMQESIRKNPLDFRPHIFLGRLYFSGYSFSEDRKRLDLAEKTLERAIELSPTNQQGYWHLAEVKLSKGESQLAYDLFQKAIDLEPRLGVSYWYLAMTHKTTGQYEEALQKVKDAEKAGYNWKKNVNNLRQVAEIYQVLRDDLSVLYLYQEAIEIHPENAEVWAGLANSYANLGQFEKAKQAAQKVIEINPDLAPEVEQFLKELPQ
ncbi:MAG: tetratricopeptide repeat protein [Candidatus Nealsonbacteria bacterium]